MFVVDLSHLCPSYPRRYYKNMQTDIAVTMCERCCQFFMQDEYEFEFVEKKCCTFCGFSDKQGEGKGQATGGGLKEKADFQNL